MTSKCIYCGRFCRIDHHFCRQMEKFLTPWELCLLDIIQSEKAPYMPTISNTRPLSFQDVPEKYMKYLKFNNEIVLTIQL